LGIGVSEWIGCPLSVVDGPASLAYLFVLFITEFTSNVATATLVSPILVVLSYALNVHPFALVIPGAVVVNFAYMMTIDTPPNAIIFTTGKIEILDMIKVGFWLNIFILIVVVLPSYFYLPVVWDFDFLVIPEEFKTGWHKTC